MRHWHHQFPILIATLLATFILFYVYVAEAADHYVGTFRDGNNAYVMTETIQLFNSGRAGAYECDIRAVKGRNIFYIHYRFEADCNGWNYKNSQRFSGYVSQSSTPIAYNILKYILETYGRSHLLDG